MVDYFLKDSAGGGEAWEGGATAIIWLAPAWCSGGTGLIYKSIIDWASISNNSSPGWETLTVMATPGAKAGLLPW